MKFYKSLLLVCLAVILAALISQTLHAIYGNPRITVVFKLPNPAPIKIEIPINASISLNMSLKSPPEAFKSHEKEVLGHVYVKEAMGYVKSNIKIVVDKEEYRVGEVVKITFINEGSSTVEIDDPPWAVFKHTPDGWVKVYSPTPKLKTVLQYDPKRNEYVEVKTREAVKIEPYGSVSWKWNMTIYGSLIEPGYYAIALRDDLHVMVDGKSLGLMRIGSLTRESLEDPVVYFTVK